MYQATDPITSKEALGALFTQMHPSQVNKVIDHIDDHLRAWIAHTTFVSIASCDAKGHMDVSPKGDPAGFIKVLDDKTLVVPKRKEVVRINGSAEIVCDDALLDMTIVNNHRPDLVLLVRVEEAFFRCGKAMLRSGMWQPDKWGPIDDLPTYAQALKDHGAMAMPLEDIEARMAYNESDRLY